MTDDLLAALTAKFMARCADDLAELQAMIAAGDPPGEALRSLVHQLAGTAGVFGLSDVGATAAEIDRDMADGKRPGKDDLDMLVRALSGALSGR